MTLEKAAILAVAGRNHLRQILSVSVDAPLDGKVKGWRTMTMFKQFIVVLTLVLMTGLPIQACTVFFAIDSNGQGLPPFSTHNWPPTDWS